MSKLFFTKVRITYNNLLHTCVKNTSISCHLAVQLAQGLYLTCTIQVIYLAAQCCVLLTFTLKASVYGRGHVALLRLPNPKYSSWNEMWRVGFCLVHIHCELPSNQTARKKSESLSSLFTYWVCICILQGIRFTRAWVL